MEKLTHIDLNMKDHFIDEKSECEYIHNIIINVQIKSTALKFKVQFFKQREISVLTQYANL